MPATLEAPRPTEEKKFEPSNVTKAKQEIIDAIKQFDTVVINAGTGSGKSLFGPLHILEGMQQLYKGEHLKMVIGEPRRFLAVGNAEKVAQIQKVPLGGTLVGYHHGEADEKSDDTQLLYTVNGSIRNMLQRDITLKGTDAVFLDEIHLREIDQYAIRIGLQECQRKRKELNMRPLKIIIASADATARDGEYHGNSKYLEIPGTKPRKVEQHFADKETSLVDLPKEMARLAARVIQEKRGDFLGFLPGRAEILEAKIEFEKIMKEKGLDNTFKAGLLTGGGGDENKAIQEKLTAGLEGRNPLAVFGTDVAETGANFPGLADVGDGGRARITRHNRRLGLTQLHTERSSFANYKQRSGRLGRAEIDGRFWALYPEEDLNNPDIHPAEQPPSILKSDLTPLLLSLKAMGLNDAYELDYPDMPPVEMLDKANKTLMLLDAVKEDGSLSDDGKIIASLPMDAHFAKMFVEAKKHGCVDAMGTLYGFLNSTKSVFTGRDIQAYPAELIDTDSDYITVLNVWNKYREALAEGKDGKEWADQHGFNYEVLEEVGRAKIDLTETESLVKMGVEKELSPVATEAQKSGIMESVFAGFVDKVLEKNQFGFFNFTDGEAKGIQKDSSSGIPKTSNYFITGDLRGGKTKQDPIYAGLNQVVTSSQYEKLKEKLSGIKHYLEKVVAKRVEKKDILAEAESIAGARHEEHEKVEKIFEQHEKEKAHGDSSHADTAHKEAEILAKIQHERKEHDTGHGSGGHGDDHGGVDGHGESHDEHKDDGWNVLTDLLKKTGRKLTYPIRTVWKWFKKLIGKGGGHPKTSTRH